AEVVGIQGVDLLAAGGRALAAAPRRIETRVWCDRGVVEGVVADRGQLDAPVAAATVVLDAESGRRSCRHVEMTRAVGAVHVPELGACHRCRAWRGPQLLVGGLQLI